LPARADSRCFAGRRINELTASETKAGGIESSEFLLAVPHCNEAAKVTHRGSGEFLVAVPMRRPRWLVPPISWILPYSSHRRVLLDAAGAAVLKMCNGKNSVETIIEKFAAENKLSFREAQLSVTQFLRQLTQRGLVVIVGARKEAKER